jgi:alpha-L-rhamnosidase
MLKSWTKTLLLGLALICSSTLTAQKLQVTGLTCEYRTNPMGIDVAKPRFGWQITERALDQAKEKDVKQAHYQIQVSKVPEFDSEGLLWDSGKKSGEQSQLIEYAGAALVPMQTYYWQVRIWDQNGAATDWSGRGRFETGLMDAKWRASWIEQPDTQARMAPATMFRRAFQLQKKVASARAYVTAHGVYELYVNGQRIGDAHLTPGWTNYQDYLQYQVYDIMPQIKSGQNAVGAIVGDGWYRGTLGWESQWGFYGKKTGLLCQIRIVYTDGTEEWIKTDGSWRCTADGPIRMNDIYNGETYDARMEQAKWSTSDFNDNAWKLVIKVSADPAQIVATLGEPIRTTQKITPISVSRQPDGKWLVDFGQNMVGVVQLAMRGGKSGSTVTVSHAEVLDKQGKFYTENLRNAKCQWRYTMRGEGEEVYHPHFTFMGFRYALIEGYPGTLTAKDVTGLVWHSDLGMTGTFECSHPLINRLQQNIQWGQRGNFLDVPTDCPQRDERLGWTGDAQAFVSTAAYNMHVSQFFRKWLRDMASEQRPDGTIPVVIPDIVNKKDAQTVFVSAGWSDAVAIVPIAMYRSYGDRQALEEQYPAMKSWVEYMRTKAGKSNIYTNGSVFGDWLYYAPPVSGFSQFAHDGYTDHDYISTAFYAHSVEVLATTAMVLGKRAEADQYFRLFEDVKRAFQREYITPNGRTASGSQTSYVLALHFRLLPDSVTTIAANHLTADIRGRGNRLSTGFLGTPYLCQVLSDNGHTDLAYELLLQEQYPSWLYPVKMGATTIWERWDGIRPDSTFQDKGMNSFNHYAYGAIGDWMYNVVAGIDPSTPALGSLDLKPHPTQRLQYARATYQSPYGMVASGWEVRDDKVIVSVEIPHNATAMLTLPDTQLSKITESGAPLKRSEGMQRIDTVAGAMIQLGSGRYVFEYPAPWKK